MHFVVVVRSPAPPLRVVEAFLAQGLERGPTALVGPTPPPTDRAPLRDRRVARVEAATPAPPPATPPPSSARGRRAAAEPAATAFATPARRGGAGAGPAQEQRRGAPCRARPKSACARSAHGAGKARGVPSARLRVLAVPHPGHPGNARAPFRTWGRPGCRRTQRRPAARRSAITGDSASRWKCSPSGRRCGTGSETK